MIAWKKLFILFLLFLFMFPVMAEGKKVGLKDFGWLSLLPPLVAIVLAFLTKQVLLSLFVGVVFGATMLNDWNLFYGFLRTIDTYFVKSAADSWNAAIMMFTISIGGLIGVVSRTGGTNAIANKLAKRAKTARSAQVSTFFMGILIFFDGLANTMIIGPTMRPLCDKLKVSREKLAFIIDSTSAPVVGVALISTWVGYELGLYQKAYKAIGVQANAYEVFLATIPYSFYNIFMLAFVFLIVWKAKDFGPMYKAEKRARVTGKVLRDGAKPLTSEEITNITIDEKIIPKAYNAIIPIFTLILVAFLGLWYNGYTLLGGNVEPFSLSGIRMCFGKANASVVLLWSAIVASIVAISLAVFQKIMGLEESIDAWVDGAKGLFITVIILILAWSLGSITKEIGAADFLVSLVSGNIPGFALPIIVFIISCLIAFATGTSWGTMAIVIPLAVPLAYSYVTKENIGMEMIYATLSSVLSGSIFGDHCSPISDTTIMSSMASASDHIDHVKTQLPYALFAAFLTIIGYLIVGFFKVSPLVSIGGGIALAYLTVTFIGKDTSEDAFVNDAH